MATVLGVEIGSDSIKIAVCSSGKVKKLIREVLPENMVREGRVTLQDAMSEFLKELDKKYKFPSKKVKMVIPAQAVLTKTLNMPMISDEELRLNLPYEFRDYMTDNKVEYVYDYAVLNAKEAEGESKGELEIFAAAVALPFLEEYRSIFKDAGFKLVAAMPREIALQNLVRSGEKLPEELAIVDIGNVRTNVDIFCNGVYAIGKTIDFGGRNLDMTVADMNKVDVRAARVQKETNFDDCQFRNTFLDTCGYAANEVLKVINFYGYSTRSEGLNDIYFCGGSSYVKNLRLKIEKATNLTPHRAGELFTMDEDKMADDAFCALAVGAGIQPDSEPKPVKAKENKKEEGDKV